MVKVKEMPSNDDVKIQYMTEITEKNVELSKLRQELQVVKTQTIEYTNKYKAEFEKKMALAEKTHHETLENLKKEHLEEKQKANQSKVNFEKLVAKEIQDVKNNHKKLLKKTVIDNSAHIKTLTESNDQLKSKLIDLQKLIGSQKDELFISNGKCCTIEKELKESLYEMKKDRDDIQNKYNTEIKILQEERVKLVCSNSELKDKNTKYVKQVANTEKELETLKTLYNETVEQSNAKFDKYQEAYKRAAEEFAKNESEFDTKLNKAQKEFSTKETEYKNKLNEFNGIEAKLNTVAHECEQYVKKLAAVNLKQTNTETKLTELHKENIQLKKELEDNIDRTKDYDDIQKKLHQTESQIKNMISQKLKLNNTITAHAGENIKLHEDVSNKENKIQELQQFKDLCKDQMIKRDKLIVEKEDNIQKLSQQYADIKTKYDTIKKSEQSKIADYDKLKNKFENEVKKIKLVNTDYEKLQDVGKNLEEKNTKLIENLSSLQKEYKKLKIDTTNELEQVIYSHDIKYEEMNTKYKNLEVRTIKLIENLSSLQKEYTALKVLHVKDLDENKLLNSKITEMTDRYTSMDISYTNKINQSKEELKKLHENYNKIVNELREYKNNVSKTTTMIEEYEQKNKLLHDKCTHIYKKYETTGNELSNSLQELKKYKDQTQFDLHSA